MTWCDQQAACETPFGTLPPGNKNEPPHLPRQVRELEQRALDVQMLKFGQVIDLELLDRVGSTQGTEELKEELREQVGISGWGFRAC